MSLWILTSLWSISSLLLACALFFLTRAARRWMQRVDALLQNMQADILRIRETTERMQAVLVGLAALNERVVQAVDAQEQAKEELWTGSWLPTDQMQADFERNLKISEDRAISTSHPSIRYSSQPSPTSRDGSPRVPLIRPAKPTGPR